MSLNEKLLAIQAEAPSVQKNAINPHFGNRYVTLDAVLDVLMPLMTANGVILSQRCAVIQTEGNVVNAVRTTLTDVESGESVESVLSLGYESNPQKIGSAITYARRYTLLSLLGLTADEDDDAEAAARSWRSIDKAQVSDRAGLTAPRF